MLETPEPKLSSTFAAFTIAFTRIPLCTRFIVSSIKFVFPFDICSATSRYLFVIEALRLASINAFLSSSPQGQKYICLTVLVKPLGTVKS